MATTWIAYLVIQSCYDCKWYFHLVKGLTDKKIDLWSIYGRFLGGVRPWFVRPGRLLKSIVNDTSAAMYRNWLDQTDKKEHWLESHQFTVLLSIDSGTKRDWCGKTKWSPCNGHGSSELNLYCRIGFWLKWVLNDTNEEKIESPKSKQKFISKLALNWKKLMDSSRDEIHIDEKTVQLPFQNWWFTKVNQGKAGTKISSIQGLEWIKTIVLFTSLGI